MAALFVGNDYRVLNVRQVYGGGKGNLRLKAVKMINLIHVYSPEFY